LEILKNFLGKKTVQKKGNRIKRMKTKEKRNKGEEDISIEKSNMKLMDIFM
jgi:hypothetical protein